MMVSVYEERYNYDWNVFLSDLGGSVVSIVQFSTYCTATRSDRKVPNLTISQVFQALASLVQPVSGITQPSEKYLIQPLYSRLI